MAAMIRVASRLLPLLFLSARALAATLPDTGQTMCDNGSNVLVACTNANTGDNATYPRQDGRFGRDANAAAATLAKIGGGPAGFDYTKIANNGAALSASTLLGTAITDWACTRDNVTGLTWEVKTSTNTDLRFSGHSYAWYNTDAGTNGGNAGGASAFTCNGTLPGGQCNTQAFAAAVNAMALCTHTDWRLPTRRELQTVVDAGGSNPAITASYFPNTTASIYWSSSSNVPNPASAWIVDFANGVTNIGGKTFVSYVRLVRGEQF